MSKYSRRKFLNLNEPVPSGWVYEFIKETAGRLRHRQIIELPNPVHRETNYRRALDILKNHRKVSRTIHLIGRGSQDWRKRHIFMVNMVNFARPRKPMYQAGYLKQKRRWL